MKNVFEEIFRAFNKNRLKYLIVGGVAVNLHGYLRFTGDLDILLLLEPENLQKLDRIMKKLGYLERLPVSIMALKDKEVVERWLKEKNLQAFSFIPPKDNPLQIDIILEESLKFKNINKQKVLKKIGDIFVPVISIEQLIKMKQKAGRPQDLFDLENLLELKDL